jgi:hypothetical protein
MNTVLNAICAGIILRNPPPDFNDRRSEDWGSRNGLNDIIRAIQPEVAPRELLKYWILEPCLSERPQHFVFRKHAATKGERRA